jgi:hypothetical protein
MPPANQQSSMACGLRRDDMINPEVVKIPVPIMLATTRMVAETNPMSLLSSG